MKASLSAGTQCPVYHMEPATSSLSSCFGDVLPEVLVAKFLWQWISYLQNAVTAIGTSIVS